MKRLALWLAMLLAAGRAPEAAAMEASDIHLRGLLDLVEAGRGPAFESNYLNDGSTYFDAYRLRLFIEAEPSARFQIFTQFIYGDPSNGRAYGAYLMFTPSPERDLHLLAGKVPWAIGTYGPRTYANRNPLIGMPLMYQYHSSLRWDQLVPSTDALLLQAGRGQYGVSYVPATASFRGMPSIYDVCWDFGLTLTGSARPLEFAVGMVNGTPGHPNTTQDENDGKSILGRLGFSPIAAIRVGVSGAYGPYLHAKLEPQLPPGRHATDYHQGLGMADVELMAGQVELRAEGFVNRWETPTVGDLWVRGGYVEGKLGFPAGFYAAGRWGTERFSEVRSSSGESEPWDYPVDRSEAGIGYRIAHGILAKAVYQRDTYVDDGEREPYDLYAAQLSVSF